MIFFHLKITWMQETRAIRNVIDLVQKFHWTLLNFGALLRSQETSDFAITMLKCAYLAGMNQCPLLALILCVCCPLFHKEQFAFSGSVVPS